MLRAARIAPPTLQELKRNEDDLWGLLPQILHQSPEEISWRAGQAVRNYYPSISCATHFLKVHFLRE